jgi:hypothetical protein
MGKTLIIHIGGCTTGCCCGSSGTGIAAGCCGSTKASLCLDSAGHDAIGAAGG